jgi:hypothetical protein
MSSRRYAKNVDSMQPSPDDTIPCIPPTLPCLLEPPPVAEEGWVIELDSEELEDDGEEG